MQVTNYNNYKNMYRTSVLSIYSLQIAIAKTGINTTRRCDLTSVLYELIFDRKLDTLSTITYKLLVVLYVELFLICEH